ncbi:MAG: S9 family peptidase [Chloroflexota bacterium]|nr:S9 family peptidase [Chloroflexota bacterium]
MTTTRATGPSRPPVEATGRPGRPVTVEDLLRFRLVGEPVMAPDGATVAVAVTEIDGEADAYRSAIWLVPTTGEGRPRRLTAGTKRDAAPRWSPDGSRLIFTSDRDTEKAQLWLIAVDGGEARRLTNLDTAAGDAAWAPDGRRVAFVAKVKPEDPNPDSDVKVITDLRYKYDGEGFLGGAWRHLFTLDVDDPDAEPVQITTGDFDHLHPAWSPSGREIAFTANRDPDWMLSRVTDVWSVVPAAGAEPRRLTPGDGALGLPTWSPDGTTVACVGSRPLEEMWQRSHVWLVPAGGGEPSCLTESFGPGVGDGAIDDLGGFSARPPAWTPDGEALMFVAANAGETHVYRIGRDGGQVQPVTAGARRVAAFSLDPTGADGSRVACAVADPVTPFEVHLVEAGSPERALTTFNAAVVAEMALGMPEPFRVPSADGTEVHGWLLRPTGPAERPGGAAVEPLVPAILEIHGGPHGMYGSSLFLEFQVLASHGYAVIYANPRGSVGYGEPFARGLHAAWGVNDLPDLLACVDHALVTAPIDPARLGVAGGSYGGFMTNWVISHDERFRAAVTQRTISNLTSMYGTDDIAVRSLDIEFGGPPWGPNADRYVALSPLTHVGRITAPLLILHAEEDHRCPMEQAEQLFIALKRLGREVELVRFPGESHGLTRSGTPKHRQEHMRRLVAWFDRYL